MGFQLLKSTSFADFQQKLTTVISFFITNAEITQKCIESGMNHLEPKPMSKDKLEELLNKCKRVNTLNNNRS